LSLLCCLVGAAPSRASDTPVELSVSRAQVSTRLGESFEFNTRIRNVGTRRLAGLVAHLDVVGLSSGIYVDPEDWSEERTKAVPDLRPGGSTALSWRVKAVTGGHAAVYVIVVPGRAQATGPERLAVSPAIDVRIADTKDLNSGGVLPLALGVPALLGAAALFVRRRRR
jgi:LPXTG-motif cell wall-anchored protein